VRHDYSVADQVIVFLFFGFSLQLPLAALFFFFLEVFLSSSVLFLEVDYASFELFIVGGVSIGCTRLLLAANFSASTRLDD